MKKGIIVAAVFYSSLCFAQEFQPLFNGKDLTGWMGKDGLWRVENGTIVGETSPDAPIPANTFLIWQGGQVQDFEFSCQVKFTGNNSGVQYRSEVFGEPEDLALRGYQADLHPKQEFFGMLYGEKYGKRGIIAKRGQKVNAKGDKKLVEVTGEVGDGAELNGEAWNTLRIVAVGNRMIHLVNDVVTVDITENHPEAIAKGFLGLQLHRGAPMKVEFKELRYRALTGDSAKQILDAAAKLQGKRTGASVKKERKAKSAGRTVTNQDGITSISGFEVEKLYTVPKEMGSWVAMGVGPDGTLYACDQKGAGVFTVKVGKAGSVQVKPLALDFPEGEKPLISAQGVSHSFGALWFHLQPSGFLKLWDSDGDGDYDKKELITQFTGKGEHGNHAVIPTEDGKGLYIDGGNSAALPEHVRSRVTSWDEDLLLSRMWDPRGHARGRLAPAGWVTKFDPNKKTQEVVSIGYRNQYDIALNRNGDLFTYDADMEWDMGSPWYRPTRICQVVSGSDYGWRSGSGKWPTYYEDSLPPVVEVGPGSPTGMIQGSEAKFPAKYRDALFAFDWTFGTIYAVHLTPEGAGYTGQLEPFVYGAPLPVTDGVIGKDGAMYFASGGRGLESHLYRVRYTGSGPAVAGKGNDTPKTIKARKLRRSLETFHGVENKSAVAKAWPHLSSADRFLRHAARVALESQPVESWAESVLTEKNAQARITGAVALARSGTEAHRAKLIASLLELDPKQLSEGEFLGLLRAYALTFIRLGKPNAEEREAVIAELDPSLPNKSNDLNTELIRVLVYLKSPSVIEKGMALIAARGKPEIPDWTELASRNERYGTTVQKMLDNYPPVQEMRYAFMLRNLKKGWTMEQRRAFFEFLNVAAKASGGASFPGYMENIRAEALANLSDKEREALADITGENFNPMPDFEIAMPKGPGQAYTLESAMKAVSLPGKADFEHGRSMFFATSCGACHRFKGLGGSIGPDLTSLPNKFDEAYLLEAIIDPGKDISDQYGSSLVTMNDGTVHSGLVIEKGDFVDVYSHDPKADPLTLSHSDIAGIKPSPVSQMPPGLINSLSPKEVKDLVIYLMSGGDPKSRRYGRSKK